MSCDMLVKLYNIEEDRALFDSVRAGGVLLKKVMAPDMGQVLQFVREHFGEGWTNEAQVAIVRNHCWIAVREKRVIGFACYDATMLNFFGPTGVVESERGKNIGKALLLRSLLSMKEMGYAYAIIGWTGPADFYRKAVGAVEIPDSIPGSYGNMIGV